MIIGGRHIRRGTHLLINQRPLVLITSPLALASPWVSPLTSTCSDCHKIIFRFAHSNTVMITATVTRDLALPAPPVAAQSPFWLPAPQLLPPRAAPGRSQARRAFSAPPTLISWPGPVMSVDDQLPGSPRGNSG